MTFKDVALKNFKAHMRKYMSYFLCSSFAIMIFFMYMTLVCNNDIMDYATKNKADIIFVMIVSVISVFSVFFINYSHFSFIKSRGKEFGLYLTLGMNRKDIGRIILIENVLIAAFSMIIGIASGTVFSRLFFMIVIKLLNLSDIPYVLDYRPFAITLLAFAAIFTCVILMSRISTRRLEISELVKQDRKVQKERLSHPFWGIAGTLLLIGYLVGIIIIGYCKGKNVALIQGLLFVGFIGMYFALSNLGKLMMGLIRKNKGLYYKRILGVTEINHKFRQNKNIVFILSVLSAVIITMLSMPVSIYPQAEKVSEKMLLADVSFVEIDNINNISPEQLNSVLKKADTDVESYKKVEIISLNMIGPGSASGAGSVGAVSSGTVNTGAVNTGVANTGVANNGGANNGGANNGVANNGVANDGAALNSANFTNKMIASESAYRTATGTDIKVNPGAAVNILYNTFSGVQLSPGETIKLAADGRAYDFKVQDGLKDNFINMKSSPSDSLLVLNDNDYNSIRSAVVKDEIGTVHLIDFKDWHKSDSVFKELTSYFKSVNKGPMAAFYAVGSRTEFYDGIKSVYAMFLFVTSFSAVLFFIASVCVLFFKQYTELEDTRRKYQRLFKIGISRREAVKLITSEMKLTYLLPVILGFLVGYPLLYAVSGVFMDFYHSESLRDSLMPNAIWVAIVYFVFQMLFYLVTRRKYSHEVIGVR